MNPKINLILFRLSEEMKIFISKIARNPDYYACKHYIKTKRKGRHHHDITW